MATRFSEKATLTALLSTLDIFLGQAKAVMFSVWLKKVLLYRKCCDTNYECCLFSVIYLWLIWCRNTLIFISGVVCKPKLTCSVFGTVYRMLCIVFPVFTVWLNVHSILVSMNFPLKEPVSSRVYEVLLEAAANWGICSVWGRVGGRKNSLFSYI